MKHGVFLGGGVDDNGLKQSLGAVGHFVAQPLPSAPGVGFLADPGGGLGSIAGLGIGPGHPQSLCKALDSSAEDAPGTPHNIGQIVLHCVSSYIWCLPPLL